MSALDRIQSDGSRYSRKNLGDAIFGREHERHCLAMRLGSELLLDAILKARAASPKTEAVRPSLRAAVEQK